MTTMRFKASYLTRQPVPDRYFTWLNLENDGHINAGITSTAWAFSLNNPLFPLNNAGGTATGLPNPAVAIATQNPTGISNMLVNANTGTGLWNSVRVWRVYAEVRFIPASTDIVELCLVPVFGASNHYTAIEAAASSPNASRCAINQGTGAMSNQSCKVDWSIPALLGIPPSVYAADSNNAVIPGSTPDGPLFGQVLMRNLLGGADAAAGAFTVRLRYHCEFFNRSDVPLLED